MAECGRCRSGANVGAWVHLPRPGLDLSYPIGYCLALFRIQQTDAFTKWLVNLRDVRAKGRILARLDSVRLGNLGDTKSIGGGVSEMRIDVGGGYRIHFTRRRRTVVILLVGGDKGSQATDIVRARLVARAIE